MAIPKSVRRNSICGQTLKRNFKNNNKIILLVSKLFFPIVNNITKAATAHAAGKKLTMYL